MVVKPILFVSILDVSRQCKYCVRMTSKMTSNFGKLIFRIETQLKKNHFLLVYYVTKYLEILMFVRIPF